MRQQKYIVSLVTIVGLLIGAGVTYRKNYRGSTCEEIEAARKALRGDCASAAVITLRKHAHSQDTLVRTQAVSAAGDMGPECKGLIREQCMEVVGEALDDPSGHVLHIAIQDIGSFGVLADSYINRLLAISVRPHFTHAVFALESLGRIGPGRREVGDRLVKAITEQYPIDNAEEFPYRTDALRVLRSWGVKACPWLLQLRHIRDSWRLERDNKLRSATEEQEGPALWGRREELVGFEILAGVVESLEKQCSTGGADSQAKPKRLEEKDTHNP